MTQKVILLKGIPASGKSTWARELLDKEPQKWKRINKDDLRVMLDNGKWSKHNEQFVLEVRDYLVKKSLEKSYNVIVDDTNLHKKHIETIKQIVDLHNTNLSEFDASRVKKLVEIEIKFFDISLNEAIERDKKRTIGHVGEKVIRDMYNRYIAPTKKPLKLEQDPSLPHCIICDVDGTIADNNGRNPYDESKVSEDLPKKEIIDIIKRKIESKKCRAIFFSGRKEKSREDTTKWINKNVFDYDGSDDSIKLFDLFMRKDDDNRKDSIVKKELFDQNIKNRFFVEFILDDRVQCVRLWRDMGMVCLQVADGDF